ncbi:hypothetical protein BHM03_00035885 [Ensete ventricosum]|nr:hypothetical protein BHM03_00035885 [Ensete ventricosum]
MMSQINCSLAEHNAGTVNLCFSSNRLFSYSRTIYLSTKVAVQEMCLFFFFPDGCSSSLEISSSTFNSCAAKAVATVVGPPPPLLPLWQRRIIHYRCRQATSFVPFAPATEDDPLLTLLRSSTKSPAPPSPLRWASLPIPSFAAISQPLRQARECCCDSSCPSAIDDVAINNPSHQTSPRPRS